MSPYFFVACSWIAAGCAVALARQNRNLIHDNARLRRRVYMAESFARMVVAVCGDDRLRTCHVCGQRINDQQTAEVRQTTNDRQPIIAHSLCLPPMDE